MRFVSLCSGIESTTVAWSPLGWEPLAYSEIDPFACAVLANRLPDVPNLGDVRNIDWEELHGENGIIDVLFASTPCQSFSVAGNRLGLSGESGLMLEFVRAVRDLVRVSGGRSPRYVVWENVPGCLTSGPKGQKGKDFGCLLRELDECGLGVSWRILDSEFAGIPDGRGGLRGPVAQCRRRVYVVGVLGTDGSGEILFERSCLSGNHPKGREARKALSADALGCPDGGHRIMTMSSGQGRRTIMDGAVSTLESAHEQPIVVMDRASFNQGENAKYPPHIEETDVVDTIVARGPHAVCYPSEPSDGKYVVRRLTPVETERLQGLPDGWTDLTGCDIGFTVERVSDVLGIEGCTDEYRNLHANVTRWSRKCPDSLRYKATGNSITTYVLEIIGRRIEAYDTLHYDEVGL